MTGAPASPSGSRPSDQALLHGPDASRVDPSREDEITDFCRALLADNMPRHDEPFASIARAVSAMRLRGYREGEKQERAAVVLWLKRHAVANQEASVTPFHSSSPARTIDLRARANSCNMHATWVELGKHREEYSPEPESYSDALTRLTQENAELREAIAASAIEAGTAETPESGSVHASAGPQDDAHA